MLWTLAEKIASAYRYGQAAPTGFTNSLSRPLTMIATTTRRRTAPGNARRSRANHSAALTLPEAKPGKFHVVLVRGRRYHLMSSDQTFEHGVPKEVDQATFEWLAEHAVDAISYVDPELGKVRRVLRKFASSPPLDEVAAETYLDFG